MKRKLAALLFVVFAIFSVSQVRAQQFDHLIELPLVDEVSQDSNSEVEENQVLGVQTAELMGPHFKFGENVVISEDLVGDVYAAGGMVRVDGAIDGDLLVAGGTVIINGEVTGNVRAAGGDVKINSLVGDDLTVVGGTLAVSKDSLVGNSVVAGGGNVDLDGQVSGNVYLGAGSARLGGQFRQNVNSKTDQLSLLPGMIVGGNLTGYAVQLDDSELAEVQGEKQLEIKPAEEQTKSMKDEKEILGVMTAAHLSLSLMGLAMGLFSGMVLIYLFPKVSSELKTLASGQLLPNLGWGFAHLILTPILAVISLMTVVGIPLAMLILAFYGVSLIVAGWVAALAVGGKIYDQTKIEWLKNKYLQFGVGLLIVNVLSLVPIFGWLVKLIVMLVGLGAVLAFMKARIGKKKKK